jgi:hypothetical protein
MEQVYYLIVKDNGKKKEIQITPEKKMQIEELINSGEKTFWVGERRFRNSDFLGFRTEERETTTDRFMKEWIQNMNQRYQMTPKERAETSRGHFSLWYWSIFNKDLSEEIWEKVKPILVKFFEKHPEFAYPTYKVYFDIFKAQDKKVNVWALALMERIEASVLRESLYRNGN